ncbi:MAG: CDP-glucose 4,6-dehydratase [Gammaproteobacteria bacterium RIFCSPHIGHO2_12_FULL_38_14]|nr:MAG: CDP-glucose 4,6-dehydratase [Gammaproteobacteria bacterium RIFCSPHIGHO2_12_FULL_38_14]
MSDFWKNKSVMVTGHTGFKGAWLALWLTHLGAKVHGYALDPPTTPSLFEIANIASLLHSDTRADIADLLQLKSVFYQHQPIVIFHLAAQPLVRDSYHYPLETLKTNTLGTTHVLEAAREIESLRAIVVITTDKVYHNKEINHPYSERDSLGGSDMYSASKAAAEIITASYRESFFKNSFVNIATARAGNVIGGGDWAKDRLIPDCITAFESGNPVYLRYPNAIRPWQHVLEPLSGYIKLAEHLVSSDGADYARAWNFGPQPNNEATVALVAEKLAYLWGNNAKIKFYESFENPHEANLLKLDSTEAYKKLGWFPRWSLGEAIDHTVSWYKGWREGADMLNICLEQIAHYKAAKSKRSTGNL